MTAIYYPDCESSSPSGNYLLEARSPHNGTIKHQDGRTPSDDEFGFKYREHQSGFRYRLLDRTDQRVIWERWQTRAEDSPHELVVSDEGWSILRTHGFRPELIAVSPTGQDAVHVALTMPPNQDEGDATVDTCPGLRWSPKNMYFSTAGIYWSENSWRYFLRFKQCHYFVWRAAFGQRLVIDLGKGIMLSEAEQSDESLALALIEEERRNVFDLLTELTPKLPEVRGLLSRETCDNADRHPLQDRLRFLKAAFHLAGIYRLKKAIPLLRAWEDLDVRSYSTGSNALSKGWWLEAQHFRPILHHSLRLLGEEPAGFPTYHFLNYLAADPQARLPMPERIPDRYDRASRLSEKMAARDVLQLLGSPDHIDRRSYPEGKVCRWLETWEYDFRVDAGWTTVRIVWEEKGKKGRIVTIERGPSSWLHGEERVSTLLQR